MNSRNAGGVALALVVMVLLIGCARAPAPAGRAAKNEPARVERGDGGGPSRVTLTLRAAERLAIKTQPAREAQIAPRRGGDAVPRTVIPYAALVYDLNGSTWTYTSPSALTFVRHPVKVDYIDGELAILSEGPSPGILVVTDGAAELFGTELGVGH
jgi:hypothetical protein